MNTVKERGILFSAPMVRAILDGKKTQTRRLYKPAKGFPYEDGEITPTSQDKWIEWGPCPYGAKGDRIWVREAWQPTFSDGPAGRQPYIAFKADPPIKFPNYGFVPGSWKDGSAEKYCEMIYEMCGNQKWRPSIHMPRWASRITLEIVSVKVERLQDISEADAIAEGIDIRVSGILQMFRDYSGPGEVFGTHPIISYASLWESINGPGSWDANPWVWVIEFRKVTP